MIKIVFEFDYIAYNFPKYFRQGGGNACLGGFATGSIRDWGRLHNGPTHGDPHLIPISISILMVFQENVRIPPYFEGAESKNSTRLWVCRRRLWLQGPPEAPFTSHFCAHALVVHGTPL